MRRDETLITANMEVGLLHRYDQGLLTGAYRPALKKFNQISYHY